MLHEAPAFSHHGTKHEFGRQENASCSLDGNPKAVLGYEALSSWLLVDELSCRVNVLYHFL